MTFVAGDLAAPPRVLDSAAADVTVAAAAPSLHVPSVVVADAARLRVEAVATTEQVVLFLAGSSRFGNPRRALMSHVPVTNIYAYQNGRWNCLAMSQRTRRG